MLSYCHASARLGLRSAFFGPETSSIRALSWPSIASTSLSRLASNFDILSSRAVRWSSRAIRRSASSLGTTGAGYGTWTSFTAGPSAVITWGCEDGEGDCVALPNTSLNRSLTRTSHSGTPLRPASRSQVPWPVASPWPTAGRLGPLSVRSRRAYEARPRFSTQGCVEKAKDGVSLGDLCSLPS